MVHIESKVFPIGDLAVLNIWRALLSLGFPYYVSGLGFRIWGLDL